METINSSDIVYLKSNPSHLMTVEKVFEEDGIKYAICHFQDSKTNLQRKENYNVILLEKYEEQPLIRSVEFIP